MEAISIVASEIVEGISRLFLEFSGGDPLRTALVMTLYAALMTTLGALLVVPLRITGRLKEEGLSFWLDVGMGFSSGVMIVASFTSLLLPALEISRPGIVLPSFVAGALAIHLLNAVIPHEHMVKGYEGPPGFARKLKAAWLVAMAIILHNLPEGMAIGASSIYDPAEGVLVGIAIGTQDFPEGLAVALPVLASTGNIVTALLVAAFSGFSEVLSGLLVALLALAVPGILAASLSFAAGAMVYVVSHEALPESHRSGHEKPATLGFFLGFLVMLYLDTQLG